MRSWGNRSDTFVTDEPLYAHYLLKTRAPHPGADDVLAHHETDWRKVVGWLTGPIPSNTGANIWYQKHMAHHLLPEIDRGWLDGSGFLHAFLIREPAEMLMSLARNVPNPTLRDTGLAQQIEIFEHVWRTGGGRVPAVIDARDVLENPRRMLTLLCDALQVPFDEAMLHWPGGPRDTDGIWAKHWYTSVEKSTTFEPYSPKDEQVPQALQPLLEECNRYYQRLHAMRLI